MEVRMSNVESQIEPNLPVAVENDFGLEKAELEMILALKAEDALDFETALTSALTSSGNDWLFDFPTERFPIKVKNVAAVRLRAGDDSKVCYVCETKSGYRLLDEHDLDEGYIEFAASYASVAKALVPFMSKARARDIH